MSPEQADALRDAVSACRRTSRSLATADRSQLEAAIDADAEALASVSKMIAELTK